MPILARVILMLFGGLLFYAFGDLIIFAFWAVIIGFVACVVLALIWAFIVTFWWVLVLIAVVAIGVVIFFGDSSLRYKDGTFIPIWREMAASFRDDLIITQARNRHRRMYGKPVRQKRPVARQPKTPVVSDAPKPYGYGDYSAAFFLLAFFFGITLFWGHNSLIWWAITAICVVCGVVYKVMENGQPPVTKQPRRRNTVRYLPPPADVNFAEVESVPMTEQEKQQQILAEMERTNHLLMRIKDQLES